MLATGPARPVRQPGRNYAATTGVLIVSPSKLTGRNKLVGIPLVHIPNDNTL